MNTTIHPFEKSGLGRPPYRLLYCASLPSPSLAEHNPTAYQNACRMLPRDVPLGSCQHCGMCIMHNFVCQSADGRKFAVGSDCVFKAGHMPDVTDKVAIEVKRIERKARRERADRKAAEVAAEWNALIEASTTAAKLAGRVMPNSGRPMFEGFKFVWSRCGASGKARWLKTLKAELAK